MYSSVQYAVSTSTCTRADAARSCSMIRNPWVPGGARSVMTSAGSVLCTTRSVRSGTRLADHTEVDFKLDQRAQSLAQNSVRLDDHDARVRRGFDHHSQTPAGVPPALCWLKLLGEPCDESCVRSEDMLR